MTNPLNPLCCNSTENGLPFELAEDTDTAFISGAYQPIINLEASAPHSGSHCMSNVWVLCCIFYAATTS